MSWSYHLGELAEMIGAEKPSDGVSFEAVSTDTRTLAPGVVFFALTGESFDGNRFVAEAFAKSACAAVTRDPNDAGPCLVVPDPLAALQAFAAHHRAGYGVKLLALTGSCGKTGTKDLIAAVLESAYRVVKTQGNLNNEIGCPLSLLQIDDETDVAVIEMGANHPGEIARLCELARPTESAITLVAPAHLEGFGTIENVAKAKGEIVDALPESGTFYVNMDNPWCVRIAESFSGKKVGFGSTGDVALESCEPDPDGGFRLRIAPVGEMRLPLACRVHVSNALLAIAVGLEHGITEFEDRLREACAVSSRFKLMRIGAFEVIDDTYNANPASVAAALETLSERPATGVRIAVLGDMLELGDVAAHLHYEVGESAGQNGVDLLFARGDLADAIVAGARAAGVGHAETIQDHEAMAAAVWEAAGPGSVVLVKGSRGMRMEGVIQALEELNRRHGPNHDRGTTCCTT